MKSVEFNDAVLWRCEECMAYHHTSEAGIELSVREPGPEVRVTQEGDLRRPYLRRIMVVCTDCRNRLLGHIGFEELP